MKQNIMPCCLPDTGKGELHVEVMQNTRGLATIYWWNQDDYDKQMDITVTNVTTKTTESYESQYEDTLFYLRKKLTNGNTYKVEVCGKTTGKRKTVGVREDNRQEEDSRCAGRQQARGRQSVCGKTTGKRKTVGVREDNRQEEDSHILCR